MSCVYTAYCTVADRQASNFNHFQPKDVLAILSCLIALTGGRRGHHLPPPSGASTGLPVNESATTGS